MNMNFLPKQTLHLYMDDHTLKLASTTEKAGVRSISGLYYRDISGLDDVGIAREIHQGLKSLGSKERQVHFLATSKYAITKTVEVPSFDEEEISSILKLQAGRHTPYSKDEIITSHISLEVTNERYTKALLVIMSKTNLNRYLETVRLAGLNIDAVHVSFDGAIAGLSKSMAHSSEEVTAVVLIDHSTTDFIVSYHEKPYFIRSISLGSKDLHQNPQDNHDALIREIEKSKEAYEVTEESHPIQRAIVLGAKDLDLTKITKAVGDRLAVGASVLDLGEHMSISPEADLQRREFSNAPMDNIMLAASSTERIHVDLIPDDFETQRRFRQRANEIIRAGTLAMVIFIAAMGIFLIKVYFQNEYIQKLDSTFASKHDEAQRLVVLSEQNRMIQEFNSQKGLSLLAMNELETLVPREMYLNELNIDSEGKVMIKGTSELMSRVFAFVTEFENHPVFKNVTSDYAKSRKVDGKDVTDFGLSAQLEQRS
jgi:Tfp pilus assembly PilM family ATPase